MSNTFVYTIILFEIIYLSVSFIDIYISSLSYAIVKEKFNAYAYALFIYT